MSRSLSRPSRDLRVDLLRGAALLFILWDHVMLSPDAANPFFIMITPALWGVSSALAIFVFLSGYVYGLVYRRTTEKGGMGAALKKTVNRAWQLYAVNLLTIFVSLGAVGGLCVLFQRDPLTLHYEIGRFFDFTPEMAWQILTLQYFPGLFNILPLYIAILLLAPFFLFLFRRWLWGAIGASIGLYVCAQFGLNLPTTFGQGVWSLNPFAWQLLFVIGMALGWFRPSLLHRRWAQWAGVLVVGLAVKIWLLPRLVKSGVPVPTWLTEPMPWSDKGTLGPVRLLYFFALAYATAYYTRGWTRYLQDRDGIWRALRTVLVKPGQHSLTVFACGIVITYVGITLLGETAEWWGYTVGVIGVAWGLSVGVALLAAARRRLASPPPTVPVSVPSQAPAALTPESTGTPVVTGRGTDRFDRRPTGGRVRLEAPMPGDP